MLLKELKEIFPTAQTKTMELRQSDGTIVKKRILYVNMYDVARPWDVFSQEDWNKVREWSRMCILPSPKGKPNEVFYFNWGYGGNTDCRTTIMIKEKK